MSLDSPCRRPVAIDRASSAAMVSRTSWGEESHIRVGPEASGGQLTILDYRAPAGFGPPRHLHQRDDEVIELVEGQVVVWTPERSLVLAPGDLVLLPKHVPHTWRAYGAEPIRFTVTFTPSGFERFFPDIERLGLVITDVPELTSQAMREWRSLGRPSAMRRFGRSSPKPGPHRDIFCPVRRTGWQRDLSVSYEKVGDVLVAHGNLNEAL